MLTRDHEAWPDVRSGLRADLAAINAEKSLPNIPYVAWQPLLSEIIAATCKVCKVGKKRLISADRRREFVWFRQAAMLIARRHTNRSFPEIAAVMGGRDHSTIVHGVQAAEARTVTDSDFRLLVSRIERELGLS